MLVLLLLIDMYNEHVSRNFDVYLPSKSAFSNADVKSELNSVYTLKLKQNGRINKYVLKQLTLNFYIYT
jgi:hypothetical protein